MIERIGRGRSPQGVGTNFESQCPRVGAHELVDAIGRDRPAPRRVVADRPEQRPLGLRSMPRLLQVLVNQPTSGRMQRHVTGLAALAGHLEVRHAAPLVLEVLHPQLAQLLAP